MTKQDIRAMVQKYITINRPQHEATIAHALDLPVHEVRRALASLTPRIG